jgi:hypothetical protein
MDMEEIVRNSFNTNIIDINQVTFVIHRGLALIGPTHV